MRLKPLLGFVIPVAFATLFARLGFWQLDRHRQRAALNAQVAARRALPPVPFDSLPLDPEAFAWRRVTLTGRFRYDLEQVLAGRSRGGSPGVHLLTPLERPGRDTLVVVTRGWVYSADAARVEHARWREGDAITLDGYALPLPREGPQPTDADRPLRAPSQLAFVARTGRPVAAVYVVMTSDSVTRADSAPRRLEAPVLEAGPHRSYALQWFSFAVIALVGGVLLFRRDSPGATPRDRA